ncbi:DUF4252 domain-containing protein [Hymenobacter psychrotolerans]|uniref:DUF4252 domain-containing protein n=1 Tax=Hymenobacter psychrotolerans DSM 18569 TaxID=1121959 RepID=A0A1M6TJE4_9BACT|nr:DUF4252 domain-containing protein [Hymenobacter psychrotolerans]SHK57050.1 protein of unknown function [Hymenobacter psychrotolerans DSM 18569]
MMRIRTFMWLPLVALLLLAGCRASGPGNPARTVAEFFNKYENRSGFKATDWSAGLTTRILLGRLGSLGGENDLTQALSSVRSFRVLTFAPTSGSAEKLVAEGLVSEVNGLLSNERYTPLTTGSGNVRYATRQQGDRVTEVVATSTVSGVPDSFMLMSIGGNFTQGQLAQLIKVLPNVADMTK